MIKRIRKKEIRQRKREISLKHNPFYKFLLYIKKEKYLIISLVALSISAITLYFVIIQYESPPDIECSVDMVQRPDSIYQFQLYIWNEGDQIADNIVIQAREKDVFQWDTSNAKGKTLLHVYPIFSVNIDMAPTNKDFHQITIPQLGNSNREDNYLIICTNVNKLGHYKALPNLVLRDKFMKLKKFPMLRAITKNLQKI